ncbi:MAG: AIPR family protein [Candidatus Methylumidiphilus sp.]
MNSHVTFEEFHDEWIKDVKQGEPSTVQLGNRFARKLITQWLDLEEQSDDIIYCDGSGDGGIDVAYLHLGDANDDGATEGDTWYLVQSKYGGAFAGSKTLLEESQKIIESLDGQRSNLSSLAQDLLDRLSVFRSRSSERDKLTLVFATEEPLNDEQKRVLDDVRAMGRNRLGVIFDVEAVSVATIYQRAVDSSESVARIRLRFLAQLVPSDEGLWVGSVKLTDLYNFLKSYRSITGDLDQLYEKNVRRFLGGRGKVNKGIQLTLDKEPEKFGLYNNGITFVAEDVSALPDNCFELVEPYIVNGCQTTRTIWDVLFKKLESGGTGSNPALDRWQARLSKGIVIAKIVQVGFQGEDLLTQITKYTNSQNAVREKDFIALSSDFQTWARQMSEKHNIFLEIQRGGWDSQKALQRQNRAPRIFSESVNAFDLLKVYASGWLGEAGLAYGKNPPFLPNGAVFKRIVNSETEALFGLDDLFAAYLLQKSSARYGFGRGAKDSRRQTKFLYYLTVIELAKYTMIDARIERSNPNITQCLLRILGDERAKDALLETAIQVIDEYLNQDSSDSIFSEPAYHSKYGGDLNAYLKWDQLGQNDDSSPKYRGILRDYQRTMKRKSAGLESPFEIVLSVLKS